MAHAYSVYTHWDNVPPIVVSAIANFLGFLSVFLFFIYAKCKHYQREKVEVPFLMYAAVSAIFRNAIKRKTVDNQTVYVIMDRKISQWFIPALFFLIQGFISSLFISFWEVFLIDVSYTCDPSLDCFPFDANNTNLQDDPIANCTDFDINDNITIICYYFAFNFTDAAGLVGGLLSLLSFVFMLLVTVLYWSLDLAGAGKEVKNTFKCKCCRCLKRIVLFVLVVSPTIGSIIAFVLISKVSAIHAALTERQSFWKFSAYYVTFMYLSVVLTPLVIMLNSSVPYNKPITATNINVENSYLINSQNSEETSTVQNSSETQHTQRFSYGACK